MVFKNDKGEKTTREERTDVASSGNVETNVKPVGKGNAKETAAAALGKICELWKKYELAVFAVILLVFAMLARGSYFDFKSGDYNSFLVKWFDEIKALGGFKGFASTIGDYTPMYKYIITILTYIPADSLYLYKAVSCIFDAVLAFYVGLIVRHFTKNDVTALIGYGVTLFLPNVFLNSGVWAQCDSIFTCFTIMSFYYMLRGNDITSMVMYGISISFKIQAIFYAPVIVIAVLRGKIKLTAFPFIFVSYILCAVPAVIAGMNPIDALFGAYLKQVGEYSRLTLNAPNLYQFLSDAYMTNKNISQMMVFSSLGIAAIIAIGFYKYKGETDDKKWLLTAYVFAITIPYILPHMHERYYYLADIFAVIFACVYAKKAYVAVLTIYPSMRVVMRYLFDLKNTKTDFKALAIIMLIGIVALFQVVYSEFSVNKTDKKGLQNKKTPKEEERSATD